MFATRLMIGFRRGKRVKARRADHTMLKLRGEDSITEQVKKVLQEADQKLILMVRG